MKTFKKNLVHEDKKQSFNLELTDNMITITHTFDDEQTAYYAAKDFITNLYKEFFYNEEIEETENTKELNASYDTEEGCILIQDVEEENEAKEALTEIIELLTTIKNKGDSQNYYKSPYFELGEFDYQNIFEPTISDLEFYEIIAEQHTSLHPQLLENIDLLHEHTDSFGLPVMTQLALTDPKYLADLSAFIGQKDLTVTTEDEKTPKEYIASIFDQCTAEWGWSSESIQLAVTCVEKKLFSIEELSKKMQAAKIDASLFATFQAKISISK